MNKHKYVLSAIVYIFSLSLMSCNNIENSKSITQKQENTPVLSGGNQSQSQSSINTKLNVSEINEKISNINTIRSSYQGFKLIGNVKSDIEKIEIVWKNGGKIDSYFLKTFSKGNNSFFTNLKLSFGNIGYGANTYIIRGYIGDKIDVEKTYNLNFEKLGCEVLFKRRIMTADGDPSEILKYKDKIRKFSIFIEKDCKDKLITEQVGSFNLDDGTEVGILDLLDSAIGSERGNQILKEDNINNLNGLKSNIKAMITWNCGDTEDQTCTKIPSDSKLLRYDIVGFNDTLQFRIVKGLTKDNWNIIYGKLRNILEKTEELSSEKIVFNMKGIEIKDISIEGNILILKDNNGIEKRITIDLPEEVSIGDPKNFECLGSCNFISVSNNKLFWSYYDGGNNGMGSYFDIITDLNTGKTIKIIDTTPKQ